MTKFFDELVEIETVWGLIIVNIRRKSTHHLLWKKNLVASAGAQGRVQRLHRNEDQMIGDHYFAELTQIVFYHRVPEENIYIKFVYSFQFLL